MIYQQPGASSSGHGTFQHPLTRADTVLVQDYMLTKVTLLLAQNAPAHEWHFEIEAMRATSTDTLKDRNDFLLDYTLSRYIAAFERDITTAPAAPPSGAAGYLGSFARAFTDAVRAENFRAAASIWTASRNTDDVGVGPHSDLTLALLNALLTVASSPVPATTTQHIPRANSATAPM